MEPERDAGGVVLIVEDEVDNQEIMRCVVEDLVGCRAEVVSDGAAALNVVGSLKPDLILMDLMMPVLDGYEAIKSIRADRQVSSIPIIAVTALGRSIDRKRAFDDGADDYLVKPFDLDLLVSKIKHYLETRSEQERSRDVPSTGAGTHDGGKGNRPGPVSQEYSSQDGDTHLSAR